MTMGARGMPSNAIELAPGQVLAGRYRVERILGQGGMGMVVSAVHIQLKTRVALKILKPQAAMFQDAAARFLREARAAANLKSEHVARVTDFGTLEDGAPFLVMEYLEGKDLAAMLEDAGALSVDQAVDYILQACVALAKAHKLGIVHRDIKPANLFVTRGDDGLSCVKVLDFGISKVAQEGVLGGETQPIETGIAWGSPHYMSPEQIRASLDMDGRTDIWALGVTLFQLVTNALPFAGTGVQQITASILEQAGPSIRAYRQELPGGLDEAIQRCLAKDRAHRWGNVAQLAQAIAPFGSKRGHASLEKILGIMPNAIVPAAPMPSSTIALPTLPMAKTMHSPQVIATPAITIGPTTPMRGAVAPPRGNPSQRRLSWPWFLALGALVITTVAVFWGTLGDVQSKGKTAPKASIPSVPSIPSGIAAAPVRSAAEVRAPDKPGLRIEVPDKLLVNQPIRISIEATERMYIALLSVDASEAASLLLPNLGNQLPVASPNATLHFPSPDKAHMGDTLLASLPAGKTSTKEKFVCLGFADELSFKKWVANTRRAGTNLNERSLAEFVEQAQRNGAVMVERWYEIVEVR